MIAADYAVQIKLIIMYTIGLLVLITAFIYLHHLSHRWFTKFSLGLLLIILIMLVILSIAIALP